MVARCGFGGETGYAGEITNRESRNTLDDPYRICGLSKLEIGYLRFGGFLGKYPRNLAPSHLLPPFRV